MALRDATEADADALARLVRILGYPADEETMRRRLRSLPGATHRTLVAEEEGSVAGFLGACILPTYESEPIGYILAMAVLPERQGRGTGGALLRAAEEWFRERGVADFRVSSGLQRADTHRFYEKAGYAKTGFRFRKPG